MNVYTLKIKNKTVSLQYKKHHYIIGFKNVLFARKVHYSLHPEPKFTIVRDNDIDLSKHLSEEGYDISLNIDPNATLFIPKCVGTSLDPMNDVGIHLNKHSENEFLTYPITKHLGIIMPYKLYEENEDEFIFKSVVIDPILL